MSRLRFAVIGAGHLGQIHARLIEQLDGVQLVAIADASQAARKQVESNHGCRVVGNFHDFMDDIDAAVVATPTPLHYPISAELLRRGVHVLVEKPITESVHEALELVSLAQEHQCTLQVGHVERFNPAFLAAREVLLRPRYIEATRNSGYTCRSFDVGAVMDLMIHDIDIVLSLVDSEVTEVHAIGAPVVGPWEDLAQARLLFANGCVANLTASRVSRQPARTMHIIEDDKSTTIDFAGKIAEMVLPDRTLVEGNVRVDAMTPDERETFRRDFFERWLVRMPLPIQDANALLEELRDFAACIRTGRGPRISGQDAVASLSLAHRIVQKLRAHQWQDDVTTGLPNAIPLPGPWMDPTSPHVRKAG